VTGKEAREVARESLVLLKNRLDTLPLKKSGTIAVVGVIAQRFFDAGQDGHRLVGHARRRPAAHHVAFAVRGALADSKRDMMGSWSAAGVADQSVTVLTGIKEAHTG
jgi:beta-glucosidase